MGDKLNSIFEATNLSKKFITSSGYTKEIINDFNFKIDDEEKGSIIAFAAPLGAGKTTLLKILCGIEKPDSGIITVNNLPIESAQTLLPFIPMEPSSLPWLNVTENIKLVFKIKDKAVDIDNVNKALSLCGLEGYEEHFPHQNSIGFRLRIALARAVSINPQIIFIDDSLRDLDTETKKELSQVLLKIKGKGITTVYAASNIKDIISIADKVHTLSEKPLRMDKTFSLNKSESEAIEHLLKGI